GGVQDAVAVRVAVAASGDAGMAAPRRGIATVHRARIPVVAARRGPSGARAAAARVVRGAGVAVVAGSRVVGGEAPRGRVAGIVGARVAVVAVQGLTPRARSAETGIGRRAGAAVVAEGPVRLRRIRAGAGLRIARSGVVALIQ